MFPLGSVLLPGGVLTLHVFEPRYQALVRDCVASESHEFGVVLIDRGTEVGGGDVRRDVGVVAQMVQVAELPLNRFAVVAVGTRRFRVGQWLPDDPYPLAEVEEQPDTASVIDTDLLHAVAQRTRRAAALALELGDHVGDPSEDLQDDPEVALFQLVDMAPLGAADRYDLLCAPAAAARLTLLNAMLDEVEPSLEFRLHRS